MRLLSEERAPLRELLLLDVALLAAVEFLLLSRSSLLFFLRGEDELDALALGLLWLRLLCSLRLRRRLLRLLRLRLRSFLLPLRLLRPLRLRLRLLWLLLLSFVSSLRGGDRLVSDVRRGDRLLWVDVTRAPSFLGEPWGWFVFEDLGFFQPFPRGVRGWLRPGGFQPCRFLVK